jgi:hypothetical protein
VTKGRISWRIVGAVLAIVGAAGAGGLYYYADRLVEQRLRPATISLLEDRLNSKVELRDMKVAFSPAFSVRGEGLVIRHLGRTDLPPLISIRSFTISGGLRQLWNRRVDRIRIEGLELMIPPRRGEDMPKLSSPETAAVNRKAGDVSIGELIAEESLLTIMSKRADKGPRVFQIRQLRFSDFTFSQPVAFRAAVTNPTPHGEIEAQGTFGPWVASEPSLTPIDGTFVFDADLATIKGIGGALHARGDFKGPLELIRTTGQTRTDDFYLSSGGEKFPLSVAYTAIVDGTNGDTTLERVDAVLGTSRISASGAIVKVNPKGRRITLDTKTRDGRLEDFVKLTTRTKTSPMTGAVNVDAKLDIPPGETEVIERMDLSGTFTVAKAQFTSETIQNRVDELARRGVGRPTDESIDDVASDLRGSFHLTNARLNLRSLTFRVEGATVRLAGVYDIAREWLDFKGELRLRARASQTQTGWKRFVLKVFDPLLDAPGAGTVLPIFITGPRAAPKFGADLKTAILK